MLPVAFFKEDIDGITIALNNLRDNTNIVNHTIEAVVYAPTGEPLSTTMMEAIAKNTIGKLTKTELDAIGIMPLAIHHKLAEP